MGAHRGGGKSNPPPLEKGGPFCCFFPCGDLFAMFLSLYGGHYHHVGVSLLLLFHVVFFVFIGGLFWWNLSKIDCNGIDPCLDETNI